MERPPPQTLAFSYQNVLYIVLRVLDHCQGLGFGGYAGLGKGYTTSVGNPIRDLQGFAGGGGVR